jgi:hypothetical protein
MKNLFFKATMLVAITLIWASCQKDQPIVTQQTASSDSVFSLSKQIEIFDASGQSSVVLNISANDQKALDAYSAENLELLVMKPGQTLEDVQTPESNPGNEKALDQLGDSNNRIGSNVEVAVSAKNLQPGIERYAISYKQSQVSTDRDIEEAWYYATYTSQINFDKTGTICRTNSALYGVFYGFQYMATSSAGWSTIVSEYQSLANNSCYAQTRNPCYQMKIKVKYRTNSRYTVLFEP